MSRLRQWTKQVQKFAEASNAVFRAIQSNEERQDALINALVDGQRLLIARVKAIERLMDEYEKEEE